VPPAAALWCRGVSLRLSGRGCAMGCAAVPFLRSAWWLQAGARSAAAGAAARPRGPRRRRAGGPAGVRPRAELTPR